VCVGCGSVAVAPSPKLHDHAVGVPVEVSLKPTVSGAVPLVAEAVKPAVGGTGERVGVIVSKACQ
jgi:hypothetical protein